MAAAPVALVDDGSVVFPDTTIMYQTKEAMRAFCLRETELDNVEYTSQRNFSGPYPIRQYKGTDLLAAAQKKYGVEGFVGKLKRQSSRWRCPALNGPAFRFFVVRGARESLKTSQTSGIWAVQKKFQNRFMQAFQDCEAVVLLFAPVSSRAFTSYGFMLTAPGFDMCANLDQKTWSTMGVMSSFKIDWKPPVHVQQARIPRLYDDQEEVLAEDGQEIPTDLGEAITELLDEEIESEERRRSRDSPRRR